jgi:L-rhamnose isomerase
MDTVNRLGYLVGKDPQTGEPIEIPIGLIPEENLRKLHNMSDEAKKMYMREIFASLPEAIRIWAGFCKHFQKQVKHRECRLCALHSRKFTKLSEWVNCKKSNLGG